MQQRGKVNRKAIKRPGRYLSRWSVDVDVGCQVRDEKGPELLGGQWAYAATFMNRSPHGSSRQAAPSRQNSRSICQLLPNVFM